MDDVIYFYKAYGMYLLVLFLEAFIIKYNIIIGFCLMFMTFILFVYSASHGEQDKDLNNQSQYSKDMSAYRKTLRGRK